MITCRDFAELVTGFLENRLEFSRHAQVRLHLLLCPSCSAYLEQMKRVVQSLGHVAAPQPAAPEDTKAALRERLRARRKGADS